jgi:hypothetical protein
VRGDETKETISAALPRMIPIWGLELFKSKKLERNRESAKRT